jgi:hypothetical protein
MFGEMGTEKMIVYHGGTEIIKSPLTHVGRDNLDFGKGFYVTAIKEQAVRWAESIASRREQQAVVNCYELNRNAILSEARCKLFEAYDLEWLEFIAANRCGNSSVEIYDYIEGGVADDRVIDTINLYIAGLMDAQTALSRLSFFQPNNQICITNQSIIDKYLIYYGTEFAE